MPASPRRTCAAAALAALIVSTGIPAAADDIPAAPVPDSDLDQMRGGYIAADGIQFDFGALVSTTVNGQMALQTQITFTQQGPQIAQTTGPNTVQGTSATTGTINGLNLQGFTPDQVKLLNNGATALIQKVTGGAVQNIVINAANNQNIQQSTQLQLTLPGFAQTQQAIQQNLATLHLLQGAQSALALAR